MNAREVAFSLYSLAPHALLNRSARAVARLEAPARLVDGAIRSWIRFGGIDMSHFEQGPFATLEQFFLRRLRPGARPLGEGIVAPADGTVVAIGTIEGGKLLQIKGQSYSLSTLLNGPASDGGAAASLEGGQYLTIFLHPSGYHFVHAPFDATLVLRRWLPGRFFPQNRHARQHIRRIYERNERLVLTLEAPGGQRAMLVMVGASMVGEICLRGVVDVRSSDGVRMQQVVRKGDEIGHFNFGSTVVLLLPPGFCPMRQSAIRPDTSLLMGQQVFEL